MKLNKLQELPCGMNLRIPGWAVALGQGELASDPRHPTLNGCGSGCCTVDTGLTGLLLKLHQGHVELIPKHALAFKIEGYCRVNTRKGLEPSSVTAEQRELKPWSQAGLGSNSSSSTLTVQWCSRVILLSLVCKRPIIVLALQALQYE